MRIAITSTGPTLGDRVDARFGRCAYYLIVDPDSMESEAIENPNIAAGGGAGIQSAQLLAGMGVQTILTGNCGPNAFQVFGAAGVQVIVGVSGVVRDVIPQYLQGALSTAPEANVMSHFGMRADGTEADSGIGSDGMGRGMGSDRGVGGGRLRGIGMGGGRGMSGGRGRGMGMGGRRGWVVAGSEGPIPGQPSFDPGTTFSMGTINDELAALRAEAQQAEERLRGMNERIAELEHGPSFSVLVAMVNAARCTGCGICRSVCPVAAVSIGKVATIHPERCTGCARCVPECPQGAISLQKR